MKFCVYDLYNITLLLREKERVFNKNQIEILIFKTKHNELYLGKS